MNRLLIGVVAALSLSVAGQAADVGALVQKLQSEKAAERAEARTLLVLEGNAALRPLLDLIGHANPTVDREARVALTRLVAEGCAPEVSDSRRAGVRDALVERLAATCPLPQRLFALQMLGNAGDPASVAAIAPLLAARETREDARRALTLIPGPEATRALIGALAQADPEFQVALLASLGRRRDTEALPQVAALTRSRNQSVRIAAIEALARLGTPEAEKPLRVARTGGSAATRAAARKAYLYLANRLAEAGNERLAATMFRTALASAADDAEACGAVAGLARLPHPPMPLLVRLLESGSPKVAGAVAQALVGVKTPQVTLALADAARRASGTAKASLLLLLGSREDPLAASAIVSALADKNEAVRVAAVSALGRLGSFADVPRLVAALGDPSQPVRTAARDALRQMPGTLVTQQLVTLAQKPAPATQSLAPGGERTATAARRTLVDLLGDRRDVTALDSLLALAADPDTDVAVAAIRGVGRLSYAGADLARLTAAADSVAAILRNASAEEERRDAAAQALLPLADLLRARDEQAALALYKDVLALAPDENEMGAALEGIGRFGDPALLPVIQPYLNKPTLRSAASGALVPIADAYAKAGNTAEAVALYRTAVKGITDRGLLRQVVAKARALGETFDLASEAGYITHWFVLGPFGKRADIEKKDVFEIGPRVDTARAVQVGERTFRWKYVALDDPTGMLDLETAVARQDDVAAYAYAEVRTDAPRDVVLHIGSDDSVACWVNGKKVHEFLGDRAWAPDQGQAEVHLDAGANAILLRVGQGGAQWAASVQITDKAGTPVRLPQRTNLDEAAARGALISWWVLGPFPGHDALKERDPIAVNTIDRQAAVTVGDKELRWRAARAVTPDGMVDLEKSVAPGEDRGAYAYAEILSPKDQDVLLLIGSDDGVACWVNGAKVHENLGVRAYQPDQDEVKARLRAGKNTLVLKVLQGGGQWALGVRVVDPDGNPFSLVQKETGVFELGPAQADEPFQARYHVLYYSLCTGFRHDIIPYSHRVLRALGREDGAFRVTVSEDAATITPENLAQYDAIVLYTTGTPFPTPEAKKALLDFVRGGKALIGIHSATDTHYDWPEFGELIGAYFDGHPWSQVVGIKVDDPNHPATRMIPKDWKVNDEIYQFRAWSRDKVHMLLTLDNSTVDVNKEGVKRADKDFAVAWCKEVGQGRVFFTSLGHTRDVWDDPIFRQHLRHGILWAMKAE